MLYHVPDLGAALAEIARVLKPAGHLYASTNGVRHMQELDELLPSSMPHAPVGEVIAGFTLENGQETLERYFPRVELCRREDALVVTEAAPLVAYCLSRSSIFAEGAQIDGGKRAAFAAHVEATLRERRGAIRITKDSGLFVAKTAYV